MGADRLLTGKIQKKNSVILVSFDRRKIGMGAKKGIQDLRSSKENLVLHLCEKKGMVRGN